MNIPLETNQRKSQLVSIFIETAMSQGKDVSFQSLEKSEILVLF